MTKGKVFDLVETDSCAHLVHIETFSGMMISLMWAKVNQNIPAMLDSMNQALKIEAEKQAVQIKH